MYLGIEIGGTKLQLGIGDGADARLIAQHRADIRIADGASGIRRQLVEAVPRLLAKHPVQRIGIGFGGPVQDGRTLKSHQVAGWDDFPLAEWCREQFGLPATVGNDCDVASLAEARLGAGRGKHTVFYVTVGTGVGGGLVIGQRLHGAGRPAVAEIGHLRPGPGASDPGDTVERVASGLGIAATARERLRETPENDAQRAELLAACGGDIERLTAQMLAQLLPAGNAMAREAFERATSTLGWAIAQMLTLVAADVVVVGGGVSLVDEAYFWEPLRRSVEQYVFPPLRGSYALVPAALGEWVVVHGALCLAAEQASANE